MADFLKLSAAELKDKLVAAGVDVPAGSKKAALVELAQANAEKLGETPSAADEADEDEEAADSGKKPEDVRMADLGFSPTGRFEVLVLNPKAPETERLFRVFGCEGAPVSPVFDFEHRGQASKIQADQNMHVRKSHGNKKFEEFVKKAEAQGFPR